MQNKNKS